MSASVPLPMRFTVVSWPGDVQQDELLDELLCGEPVAFVLGRDHAGEQIVAGVRALPRDELVGEVPHRVARDEDRAHLVGREDRVEALHDRAGPLAQLRPVAVVRDAEHLRDDRERQREREVGDHVHLAGAARLDRVEVLVDELLHARREPFDHARREHLRHEPPQPVVVGRVEVEHRVVAALLAGRRRALAGRAGTTGGGRFACRSSTERCGSRSTRCTSS